MAWPVFLQRLAEVLRPGKRRLAFKYFPFESMSRTTWASGLAGLSGLGSVYNRGWAAGRESVSGGESLGVCVGEVGGGCERGKVGQQDVCHWVVNRGISSPGVALSSPVALC